MNTINPCRTFALAWLLTVLGCTNAQPDLQPKSAWPTEPRTVEMVHQEAPYLANSDRYDRWFTRDNPSFADWSADRQLREFRFDGVALGEILDFLADTSGIPISVDWVALAKEKVTRNTPVKYSRLNVSRADALREILARVQKAGPLGYIVDSDGIRISTAAEFESKTVTHHYNVAPLVYGEHANGTSKCRCALDTLLADVNRQLQASPAGSGVAVRVEEPDLIVTASEPKQVRVRSLVAEKMAASIARVHVSVELWAPYPKPLTIPKIKSIEGIPSHGPAVISEETVSRIVADASAKRAMGSRLGKSPREYRVFDCEALSLRYRHELRGVFSEIELSQSNALPPKTPPDALADATLAADLCPVLQDDGSIELRYRVNASWIGQEEQSRLFESKKKSPSQTASARVEGTLNVPYDKVVCIPLADPSAPSQGQMFLLIRPARLRR